MQDEIQAYVIIAHNYLQESTAVAVLWSETEAVDYCSQRNGRESFFPQYSWAPVLCKTPSQTTSNNVLTPPEVSTTSVT